MTNPPTKWAFQIVAVAPGQFHVYERDWESPRGQGIVIGPSFVALEDAERYLQRRAAGEISKRQAYYYDPKGERLL